MKKAVLLSFICFVFSNVASYASSNMIYYISESPNKLSFYHFDLKTFTAKELTSIKDQFEFEDFTYFNSKLYAAKHTNDGITLFNLSDKKQSIIVKDTLINNKPSLGKMSFSPSGEFLAIKNYTMGEGGETEYQIYKYSNGSYQPINISFGGYDSQNWSKNDSWLQIGSLHTDYTTPTEVAVNIKGNNGGFISYKIGEEFFRLNYPLTLIDADVSPDFSKLAVLWKKASKKSATTIEYHFTLFDIKKNKTIENYKISLGMLSYAGKSKLNWDKYGIFLLSGDTIYKFDNKLFKTLSIFTKPLRIYVSNGGNIGHLPPRDIPFIKDFDVMSDNILLLHMGNAYYPGQLRIWDYKQDKILWQSQESDFLKYKVFGQ